MAMDFDRDDKAQRRRRWLQIAGGALAGGASGTALAADPPPAATANVTRLDLSNADDPTLADALIGVKSPLRGAARRTQHSKNADTVSAFDFMVQSQIDAVVGGHWPDVTAELQAAVASSSCVYLPDGSYRISRKIAMRTDSCLQGQSPHGVRLQGPDGGVIFEFPYLSTDCVVRNIHFSGNAATAVAVASANGPFAGYLVRATIEDCHFDWRLAFGINADLIYARISRCSFGYYGEGKNSHGLVGIRSFNVGANYTNLNSVRHCIFSTGTSDSAACELSGGIGWDFFDCDWSHAGMAVRANNIQLLRFDLCWFESNTVKSGVIQILASDNFVEFNRCIFQNNNAPRLIQWSSRTVRGVSISNCSLGLVATGSAVYDESTDSYRLNAKGALSWRDNTVSGGHPENTLVTALNSGESGRSRGWAIVSTGGNVVASSEPGLRARRNSNGDVSLSLSHPAASAPEKLCVVGTGRSSTVRAFGQDNPSTIRVRCVDPAGNPVEDTVSLTWFGI